MSFAYKTKIVTLDNYREVFKGYSSDTLDEIRLAVLDDTPIGRYIQDDKDGYTLSQYRKALRENIPAKYLGSVWSGTVIRKLRQLFHRRGEKGLKSVESYICHNNGVKLSDDVVMSICDAVLDGADISKVDFFKVKSDNVPTVCSGLSKSLPMWLCAEEQIEQETMLILMKGMILGVDIHPFIKGDWDNDVLLMLFSSVKDVNIQELVASINSKFSKDCVEEIIKAMRMKLDFSLLCLKDKEGYPVFNDCQMSVLSQCMISDVLTEQIYNPKLSDIVMQDLYMAEMEKKAKSVSRLGGSLKKGVAV